MDQALLALMKQLSAEEKLMFQSDYEDQKKSTVLAVVRPKQRRGKSNFQ